MLDNLFGKDIFTDSFLPIGDKTRVEFDSLTHISIYFFRSLLSPMLMLRDYIFLLLLCL